MTRAWRLTKRKHQATAFEGIGAREGGGRWNSVRRAAIYLGTSPSLAALEVLVHEQRARVLKSGYVLIPVDIPDACILELDAGILPEGWNDPSDYSKTQAIGDDWLDQRVSVALRVPSAVVPLERNIVLNPEHPDMNRLTIHPARPFLFDPRLLPTDHAEHG